MKKDKQCQIDKTNSFGYGYIINQGRERERMRDRKRDKERKKKKIGRRSMLTDAQ